MPFRVGHALYQTAITEQRRERAVLLRAMSLLRNRLPTAEQALVDETTRDHTLTTADLRERLGQLRVALQKGTGQ